MAEFGLPRSDEPFDFRHQAALYGRYRRDYSRALYDAIEARVGPPSRRLVADVLARFGALAAAGVDLARELTRQPLFVHAPEPFAPSTLEAEPPLVLDAILEFTAEEFHGWVATLEWVRRLTGPDHAA